MRIALAVAALLLTVVPEAWSQAPPAGNAEAGRTQWAVNMRCGNCHGTTGEGGFGPDLAGRGLSLEQFRRAVRQPWGIMPAYSARQLSDQAIADMWAFTSALPKSIQVGRPRFATVPGSPAAQVQLVEGLGCANCHGPEVRFPRQVLGRSATEVDFEHFAKIIHEHDSLFPEGRMGSYSRQRVSPAVLRDVYWFVREELGLLATMQATIGPGTSAGVNSTHTLTLRNGGTAGKGLTTEELTVTLRVPDGSTVSEGTRVLATASDGTLKLPLAKVLPGEERKFTVTIPGSPRPPADLVKQGRVDWLKPALRPGVPDLQLKDERWGGSLNDWAAIGVEQTR